MKCVWKISPGDYASALDYFENQNYIGIGWSELGNLRKYKSKADIRNKLKHRSTSSSQIWNFYKKISKKDIIFLYGNKRIYTIGTVIGKYYFQKKPDYQTLYLQSHYPIPNRRKVEWKILFSPFPVNDLPKEIVKKLGQRNTIKEFTNEWPIIKKHIEKHLDKNPNISCGFSHEPENEQQVIALFARYFDKIGFSKILSIYHERHKFPDAEALTNDKRHVLIEFEHRSSNARNHGKRLDKIDYLVCWEHDWKNYPYRAKIIELKGELGKVLK